jgi:meso-butanediol dehydrogenase / (S,S)-butanediol dehydrogenase / diacetyl reductase
MSTERFSGKVIVVTGAGHGIGRACADRFAAEGAEEVVVVDIDERGAEESVRLIRGRGGRAHMVVADVADEASVEALRRELADRHGRVDVVHNNAGRLRSGKVTELSIQEWDLTFAVNVRAMFLVCRALIPLMPPAGGAIVNTASSSGLVGEAATPAYNASKAAIINFTRQLAADYSRVGIRANSVCPGWVPTGFNDPVLSEMTDREVAEMVTAMVPVGRQARTEEIAAAVAFLASDDASYIAGHALVVDGGLTAVR